MTSANPIPALSGLPYQIPDFAGIRVEHFAPAIENALAEHAAEIRRIAAQPEPADFENTLVAMQASGRALRRVLSVFSNQVSTDSDEALLALEERFAPVLAAHEDDILLDPALFARIDAVHEQREALAGELSAESLWLIERTHLEFTRGGAGLQPAEQEELRRLNQELSTLSARFGSSLLAETNELAVVFDTAEELDGLDQSAIAAAAEAAAERSLPGKYLIPLVLYTGHPYLAQLTVRASRERIMRASLQRCRRGGGNDTGELVLRQARLRARRAELLGYPSHAAYVLADETAGDPQQVERLLEQLIPPALRNASAETARLQELIDEDGERFALASWDWPFYAERLREREYQLDTQQLRDYFEAERVLHDGVFYAAARLYGLHLEERPELIGHHPDVRVFEVTRNEMPVGLYLLDLYTRDSKRGGAWMTTLSDQNTLLSELPVIVNVLNVVKPPAGEPTLLTLDEAFTLFHEFGHGLHGLLSKVHYPKFSGTNVPRDFVELPSQLNETWMLHPEVLANYAYHHRTGEPIPRALVDALTASRTFDQGHETVQYLAATVLDQAWHGLSSAEAEAVTDVEAFEREALERAGLLLDTIPTRYASSYFQHVFAGGYSAAYYSYIWSEVLDADAEHWFSLNGGLSREAGEHYLSTVLSVGGSRDPKRSYEAFRGGEAEIEPLLVRRGLTAGAA